MGSDEYWEQEDSLQLKIRGLRSSLLNRMREADRMSSKGIVQHGGSEANLRRQAQREILQEAWGTMWPLDRLGFKQELSLGEMSTLLNAFPAPEEREMAIDFLFVWRLSNRTTIVSFPRGNLRTSIDKYLHPADTKKRRRKREPEPEELVA